MLLFPIGTDRQLRGFPWLTVTLIAINTGVFFLLEGGPQATNFSLVWGHFAWWMPITYMFTHADIFHLLGNMLFLWVFGPHAEDALGRGRFLLLYFSAGLASAGLHVLASAVFYPGEAGIGLVGASGAIMGVVALFVLRFHGVRVRFFFWLILPYIFYVRALWVGIVYLAWDLAWALVATGSTGGGGVAHWAHVGGFVAGAVWAWAMHLPEEGTHEIKHEEARRLLAAGAVNSAASLLEEGVAARPADAELHADAAMCYEKTRDGYSQAAAHWNAHLRLLLQAGESDAALTRFRLLIARYRPQDLDAAVLLRLGAVAEGRGIDDLALPAWMAVVQAHAGSEQAPAAALRTARLLHRNGRDADAERLLQQLEADWPDSQQALVAAQLRREMDEGTATART